MNSIQKFLLIFGTLAGVITGLNGMDQAAKDRLTQLRKDHPEGRLYEAITNKDLGWLTFLIWDLKIDVNQPYTARGIIVSGSFYDISASNVEPHFKQDTVLIERKFSLLQYACSIPDMPIIKYLVQNCGAATNKCLPVGMSGWNEPAYPMSIVIFNLTNNIVRYEELCMYLLSNHADLGLEYRNSDQSMRDAIFAVHDTCDERGKACFARIQATIPRPEKPPYAPKLGTQTKVLIATGISLLCVVGSIVLYNLTKKNSDKDQQEADTKEDTPVA